MWNLQNNNSGIFTSSFHDAGTSCISAGDNSQSEYDGEVYDFEVPEVQNFIGGFGGIFLHNSGHAAREDHRDILKILKPKYVMPAHDGRKKQLFMKELAMEEGWKENRILLMEDGKKAKLDL